MLKLPEGSLRANGGRPKKGMRVLKQLDLNRGMEIAMAEIAGGLGVGDWQLR